MKISYNWLQSFFLKKLPEPKKLADLLTFHSFEVEEIKQEGSDFVLEIDVLPNRAHDCLSYLGVAREISALLNYPIKRDDYSGKIKVDLEKSINDLVKIEVREKELCLRYMSRGLVEVKVGPSPKWIQERLTASGLKPISNVVDIANYVMLETGQPLHAFDADKLKGGSLIIRKAKKGEKITTLDGDKYDLDEDILVIADGENPVCIAGIKGGNNPEIDGKTKNVVLEAANFSSQSIRRASRKLKLRTDASWRFENELDPNLTKEAIDMAACLIQGIAQGKVVKDAIDIYSKKVNPKKVKLDINQVEKLLGAKIPEKQIKDILKRLGFGLKSSGSKIEAIAPTSRLDISIPEDLIEEIGRIYGFEKISSKLPEAVMIPAKRNEDLFYQSKVRDILTNLGFSETYNYSFVGDKEKIFCGRKDLVELANPISQEQKYLRRNLTANLVKNVKENRRYFSEVRLFEIGQVFERGEGRNGLEEKRSLAAVVSLNSRGGEAVEFYSLKGVVDSLLNKLGMSDQWYDDSVPESDDFCHSDRKAEIKVGQDYLGRLFEVDRSILEQAGIGARAAVFEIDFEKLVELATEERIYSAPSKYPAVIRDIALLVEPGTKVAEVLNLINSAGGALVQDVDLFDIYQGENIPDGRKNLAFHIIFQADDHTLTDQEVNKIQDKIIKTLEQEGGWEVRKQNG